MGTFASTSATALRRALVTPAGSTDVRRTITGGLRHWEPVQSLPSSQRNGFVRASRRSWLAPPFRDCDRWVNSQSMRSRSGSGYGNGLRRTPFTIVKIAVFAPIPKANVSTTTNEKARFLERVRKRIRHPASRYPGRLLLSYREPPVSLVPRRQVPCGPREEPLPEPFRTAPSPPSSRDSLGPLHQGPRSHFPA
jgi:hypothetical protein